MLPSLFLFYKRTKLNLKFFLSEFYKNESNSKLYTIEKYSNNLICAAKYTANDLWYRAAIYDVDHKMQIAAVFFFDYGQVEKLPFHRLRLLKDNFFEQKVLAVPVTLKNVNKFLFLILKACLLIHKYK